MGCTPAAAPDQGAAAAGAAGDHARPQPDDHAGDLDAGHHRAGRHPRPRPGGLYRARQGRRRPRPGRRARRRLDRDDRRPPDDRWQPCACKRRLGLGAIDSCRPADRRGAAAAAALPLWSDPVEPEPICAAASPTSTSWSRTPAGRYVVRIGGDIDAAPRGRAQQRARGEPRRRMPPASRRRWCTAEPGALVLDFIEGRTFTPDDVRDAGNARPHRRADPARCTPEIPKHLRGPAPIFWVFHVVRDYAHTLAEAASPTSAAAAAAGAAEQLERAVGPIELVFGHNDLLAANLIDDGKRLWLVDWEYAGFNSPLFDLGGLASNSELPPPMQRGAARGLFRPARSTDELRRRSAAMTAASLLRETMWSMVSELHSHVDFDYRRLHGREPAPASTRRFAAFQAMEPRMTDLPASAKVVIVGGGIVGCSVAYHLGKTGLADVLLLERAQAHLRLDLACGRPGRPAPHQRQHHPAARLLGRALRPAGGGDRPRDRLEAERRPAPRLQRRALDRGASARRRRRTASASRCTCCRRRRRRTSGR